MLAAERVRDDASGRATPRTRQRHRVAFSPFFGAIIRGGVQIVVNVFIIALEDCYYFSIRIRFPPLAPDTPTLKIKKNKKPACETSEGRGAQLYTRVRVSPVIVGKYAWEKNSGTLHVGIPHATRYYNLFFFFFRSSRRR